MAGKRRRRPRRPGRPRARLPAARGASRLLKELETAKFDETVEVHFRLGVNVRHADQQLRGTIMLPHGTGRTARVAVFAQGDKAKRGRGGRSRLRRRRRPRAKIQEGSTDFDVAIATPDMMVVVGRLGRILGPQGKMPNPKTGTVTMDVAKAIEEVKAGKIEYRTDRTGIVHVADRQEVVRQPRSSRTTAPCSRRSCASSRRPRRAATCKSITLASTMGPGIKVDSGRVRDLMEDSAQS